MPINLKSNAPSKTTMWIGRIMSAIVVLFLVADGVTKLLMLQPVVAATTQIGYPVDLIQPIGIIGLVCAILYAMPRTAFLGAILTTGLLGGAIASKLRLEEPLFSQVLFGVYVGILMWGGLFLREGRLRALFPYAAQPQMHHGPTGKSQVRW